MYTRAGTAAPNELHGYQFHWLWPPICPTGNAATKC
jgi:hypothetical protein